jgi:hypothetical protein
VEEFAGSAADRGQKRYFIAVGKRRLGIGELLVQCKNNARGDFAEPGKTRCIILKNGVDTPALGNVDGVFAQTDNVAQNSEK